MTQASPTPTAQGYTVPSVTQFGVFLENKVGKLLDLVELFDRAEGCDICAFSVQEASDHAVVRIITNNAAGAKALLREEGLPFSMLDVMIVELIGGHTLSSLCLNLLGAELSIRFAYPVMLRPNGTPTVAISVDDLVLGGQILRRKGFQLLGECDLPHKGDSCH
ncbi:MAG: hypothetical protein AAGD00_02110 [Planctomycetota bacterium]